MAEKVLVSPGVFSSEIDLTSLPDGVAGIGAAVIGRTLRGPAFKVGTVNGWNDFESTYGSLDPDVYVPYGAKEYLKNQNTLNVVRVLGVHSDEYAGGITTSEAAGFTASMAVAISHSGSYGWQVATVIHTNVAMAASGSSQSAIVFDWGTGGYNSGNPFTGSYVRSARNYVEKVLNTDPTRYETASFGHYIWQNFGYNSTNISTSNQFSASYLTALYNATAATTFSLEYTAAATPWVYSQNFGSGSMAIPANVLRYRLFRLVAKDDGEWPNSNIKVSIENMRKSINEKATEYGYFDVVVRSFSDTDKRQSVIEQFVDCTFDPDDTVGYVARKIGDRTSTWDTATKKFIESGEFDSKSKYIRVELDQLISTQGVPKTSLPWGFYGFPKIASSSILVSGTIGYATIPSLPYVSTMTWKGDFDSKIHWGVAFNDVSGNINYGISDRMKILPYGVGVDYDPVFSLDYLSSSDGAKTASTDLTASIAQSKVYYAHEAGNCAYDAVVGTDVAQFALPLYGGFDGFNIHRSNPIDNMWMGSGQGNSSTQAWNTSTYLGSYEICSVRRAVDIIRNPELVDFNLLCIPGIFHPGVVNYAIQAVEDRGDAFYIADISGSSVDNVKSWMDAAEFDTNYCATYYPWIKYYDETNNKDTWLPPSITAFGAYAYNDRVAQPWFAPAGFNRAAINAKDVKDRLTYLERNELQNKNVNPIARFPSEGIVIYGQKTLQVKESALTRVNVRRLMIYLRKTIASSARFLLFEPNIASTWNRFVKIVTPILQDVFTKYGIEKYKITFDETTNTPEMINDRKMGGRIYIIPTKAAEVIELGFILSPTGATFDA
jgi:hypothetical protein